MSIHILTQFHSFVKTKFSDSAELISLMTLATANRLSYTNKFAFSSAEWGSGIKRDREVRGRFISERTNTKSRNYTTGAGLLNRNSHKE